MFFFNVYDFLIFVVLMIRPLPSDLINKNYIRIIIDSFFYLMIKSNMCYVFYSVWGCSNTLLHPFWPFQTPSTLTTHVLHPPPPSVILHFDIISLSRLFFVFNFFFAFFVVSSRQNEHDKKQCDNKKRGKKQNVLFLSLIFLWQYFLLPLSFHFFCL